MLNKLSAIVLTHNEEDNIIDCLELLTFADEIIVIDDNSNDRTIELAHKFTDKVYSHSLNNNFSNQRNYALNLVRNAWVLFVDADERVSENLKNEIIKSINKNNEVGYLLKRVDVMWGRMILHGEVGDVRLLRLAKKGQGKWHGKVHESWEIIGKKVELKSPLIHSPHPDMGSFMKDIDLYSSLRAQELFESKHKSSFLPIIFYPFFKFIQNYVIRKGHKDGIPGFLYAVTMSFHSFLVRSKLYLLTHSIK